MADSDFWSDFYNNLATDIAPIITLFGEQPTKQFLSESIYFTDSLTLAILPIGVLTIVVSAIRVSNSGLRSFIGRAQEPEGVAEIELCSSTSDTVCEVWGGSGVTRIFGRPKLLEFVCHRNSGDCHDDDKIPFFTISSTQDLYQRHRNERGDRLERCGDRRPELGKPNLTLNIALQNRSRVWSSSATLCSVILATSWIWFAVWLTRSQGLKSDTSIVSDEAALLALLISGSVVSWIGLTICSHLVNRTTEETHFIRRSGLGSRRRKSNLGDTIFWLQPDLQTIGDQLFGPFAYSQPFKGYTTSLKTGRPAAGILLWTGVVFSILGWALQFFCLRSLHAFVSIYLLGSTFVMATLRALVRARRLDSNKNDLHSPWLARIVQGHELDWQALRIEQFARVGLEQEPPSPEVVPEKRQPDDPWRCDRDHEHSTFCQPERRTIYEESSSPFLSATSSFGLALAGSDSYGPARTGGVNAALRVLHYRSSLARLAHSDFSASRSERWDVEARTVAIQLQQAIQSTANHILSGRLSLCTSFPDEWLAATRLHWTIRCRFAAHSYELFDATSSEAVSITLSRTEAGKKWEVNVDDLEACLGLWFWSLAALRAEADQAYSYPGEYLGFVIDGIGDSRGRRLFSAASRQTPGLACLNSLQQPRQRFP
ncbi:hypothetical protein QBC34DRAFT_314224 [Podospora aff. communis PSN243]|uniref:Uncharacterized protein n=1 Tax=Podospora aff. communis PSN243 TaxID=3040156 RepID=A0AAV9FUU2_9PEZI|nr:hypothetical protein QBC34DRAFT_314224 [Podospora aff. communis PSN243]